MIKRFLFVFALFMATTMCVAGGLINLTVKYDDPSTGFSQRPRASMRPPVISLEGNTIVFQQDHPEYLLVIKDKNGDICMETVVFSTQEKVQLPPQEGGEYGIELHIDNWNFQGVICL